MDNLLKDPSRELSMHHRTVLNKKSTPGVICGHHLTKGQKATTQPASVDKSIQPGRFPSRAAHIVLISDLIIISEINPAGGNTMFEKLSPEGEVLSADSGNERRAQVLVGCLEQSAGLVPGQFPHALETNMEVIKSREGNVNDMSDAQRSRGRDKGLISFDARSDFKHTGRSIQLPPTILEVRPASRPRCPDP